MRRICMRKVHICSVSNLEIIALCALHQSENVSDFGFKFFLFSTIQKKIAVSSVPGNAFN